MISTLASGFNPLSQLNNFLILLLYPLFKLILHEIKVLPLIKKLLNL